MSSASTTKLPSLCLRGAYAIHLILSVAPFVFLGTSRWSNFPCKAFIHHKRFFSYPNFYICIFIASSLFHTLVVPLISPQRCLFSILQSILFIRLINSRRLIYGVHFYQLFQGLCYYWFLLLVLKTRKPKKSSAADN